MGLRKREGTKAEDNNKKPDNCILGSSKDSEMEGSNYHKRWSWLENEDRGVARPVNPKHSSMTIHLPWEASGIFCGEVKPQRLKFVVYQAQQKLRMRCGEKKKMRGHVQTWMLNVEKSSHLFHLALMILVDRRKCSRQETGSFLWRNWQLQVQQSTFSPHLIPQQWSLPNHKDFVNPHNFQATC